MPINTRIRVALQMGITSSKHDVAVLAQVLAPVKQGERTLIPQGAILKGVSSSDKERVFVRFVELIVEGRKQPLTAAAVEGDYPGLKAQKRAATLEERQRSRVAQGVLGVAADLVASAAGPAGGVVRGVGDGAVRETQDAQEFDESVVLVVPAKTQFEAVVLE